MLVEGELHHIFIQVFDELLADFLLRRARWRIYMFWIVVVAIEGTGKAPAPPARAGHVGDKEDGVVSGSGRVEFSQVQSPILDVLPVEPRLFLHLVLDPLNFQFQCGLSTCFITL